MQGHPFEYLSIIVQYGGFVWFLPRSPNSALLPFFWGKGSPTKIYHRNKGTLIPTSVLEDLGIEAIKS